MVPIARPLKNQFLGFGTYTRPLLPKKEKRKTFASRISNESELGTSADVRVIEHCFFNSVSDWLF